MPAQQIIRERWPELMTRAQAAEYLAMSETSFDSPRQLAKLRSVKIPNTSMIRFRRWEIDKWIDTLPYGEGKFRGAE